MTRPSGTVRVGPDAETGGDPLRFRPDIEGLRAVAVLLVLLYHAGVPAISGGYVGVDVFFVVSGFLITGLILRELEARRSVSLSRFYARRARRLLPAATLTLVVTLAASVVLLPFVRIPAISIDVAAAATYVSNLRFGVSANDYFAAAAAPSPVLHFWSLSLEEQFYLFWPLMLLLTYRVSSRWVSPMRGIAVMVGLVSVASFVACIWLTGENEMWAFFLLPTRAWELGLGALVMCAVPRLAHLPHGIAPALVGIGLMLIAAAALLFDESTRFPGAFALVPTLGTAMVIVGSTPARRSWPSRMLTNGPCRFLGRVSYSTYLWHWPMLVFAAAIHGSPLPLGISLVVAFASIPVAALTQFAVERPFRLGRLIGVRPRWNLAQAVISALVIVAISAAAAASARSVVDDRLAGLQPPVSDPRTLRSGWCIKLTEVDDPNRCVEGDPASSRVVVLFGDSQAEHWTAAMTRMAVDRGWRLVSLTRPSCYSLDFAVAYDAEKECPEWREHVFARIRVERPDLVVLSNHARLAFMVDGRVLVSSVAADRDGALREWGDGLSRTLARLTEMSTEVAIIGETPLAGVDVPSCLVEHADDFSACDRPLASIPEAWLAVDAAVAAEHGATFIDPTEWLCPAERCPAVIDNMLVYRDTMHMGEPFSASLTDRLAARLPDYPGGRR